MLALELLGNRYGISPRSLPNSVHILTLTLHLSQTIAVAVDYGPSAESGTGIIVVLP